MTTVVPEWDLADRLRKALRESGIGAGEMAEYMGVNRTTVSAWLTGKYYPRKGTLRLWALRTGVPFEWLAGDDAAEVRREGIEPPTRWLRLAADLRDAA